jgi:Dockerin type I domain
MKRFTLYLTVLMLMASTALSHSLLNLKQWKISEGGNDHWYAVYDSYAQWVRADSLAKTLPPPAGSGLSANGYLVTILSPEENAFVRDSVLAGTDQQTPTDLAWIGASWRADLGRWAWETGEEFAFAPWATGEPSGFGIVPEVGIYGPKSGANFGLWRDTMTLGSQWTHWSVVEWGELEGVVTPLPPRPLISQIVQWKQSDGGNGHWFGVLATPKTWYDANSIAPSFIPPSQSGIPSGYLAALNSWEEQVFINTSDLISSLWLYEKSRYWLGGHRHPVSGERSWSNGEAFTFQYPSWGESWNGDDAALTVKFTPDWYYHWISELNWRWSNDPSDTGKLWSIIEWGATNPIPYSTIANVFQWPKASGGNNHWYAFLTKCLTKEEAETYLDTAQIVNPPGVTSRPYLATLVSYYEFWLLGPQCWDFGFEVPNDINGFWIGGQFANGRGSWDNGEPFTHRPYWVAPGPDSTATSLVYHEGGYYSRHFPDGTGSPKPYVWSIIEWGTPFCGDVSGDQKVNVVDMTSFVSYLFGGGNLNKPENADGSGDGSVNVVDLTALAQYLFSSGSQLACPPL